MKRIALAALLIAAFAPARADEGAYLSLVGMARSARTERAPDVGDIRDRAIGGKKTAKRPPVSKAVVSADDGRSFKDAVAAPPATKPRFWTRLYATLLPAWRRAPPLQGEFEAAVSSAPRAFSFQFSSIAPARSEAAKSGERRGLAELFSATAAPSSGE